MCWHRPDRSDTPPKAGEVMLMAGSLLDWFGKIPSTAILPTAR